MTTMTAQQENTDIFGVPVIASAKVRKIEFKLYESRIFYVKVPKFEKIDEAVIRAGYEFLDKNGGGEFYNIYHFESFAEADPETREWAASPENNKYTICDAIVIGSMSQKLVTDFYLRINKPVKPTKVFFSLKKAAEWVHKRRKKDELS